LPSKDSEVATGGFRGSVTREEFEAIGKRRPFGQVNDSRVDSSGSSKRLKGLKI